MSTQTSSKLMEPRMGKTGRAAASRTKKMVEIALAVLAFALLSLAVFQLTQKADAKTSAPASTSPLLVYDARGAMEAAVVESWEVEPATSSKPILVYDARAAMEAAVVESWEVTRPEVIRPVIVYTAEGPKRIK